MRSCPRALCVCVCVPTGQMMTENTAILAVVTFLGELIAFLGKCMVACVSGFAAFWYIERTAKFQPGGPDAVSSSWFPVLVSVCLSGVRECVVCACACVCVRCVCVCVCGVRMFEWRVFHWARSRA